MQPFPMTHVSDSEASTVPAKDEDVRKHVLQGLKAGQVEETHTPVDKLKRKGAKDMDQLSSEPKLPRKLQSKPILKEGDEGDEAQVEIKKSDTAETLPYPAAAKATAVKAKAGPPKTKIEPETPTSKAVSQCLGRASTQELQAVATPAGTPSAPHGNTPTTPTAPTAPPPPVAPQAKAALQDDPGSDAESSVDSEELRRIEREQKAKREAHARYMRFSRSLTSTLG